MGCKFEFHAYSGCFSSGSYSLPMNLRLHSHEFLFPANESQTAFPWVPIPLPMNLRLHSHESLFPCQWISGCLSSSPYSLPMNLWMHSMSSYSLPMDSISGCIPMSSSPCLWISGCLSSSPYSQPMNLWMHSMSSYSHAKFLESFGWVPPMSYHPDSKHAHRSPKNRILARFWVHPYTYHMGTPKIA